MKIYAAIQCRGDKLDIGAVVGPEDSALGYARPIVIKQLVSPQHPVLLTIDEVQKILDVMRSFQSEGG